jgi:hypothetical protein
MTKKRQLTIYSCHSQRHPRVLEQDQSQWAEGRHLFEWFFNNLTMPGFYSEMRALDGHELSNTYSFIKK